VKLEIYKKGQGKYTRVITLVSVMALGVIGAAVLSDTLKAYFGPYIQFGVPTALVIGLAVLMFWLINRAKTADFLIATEGEMKKVSWSSKKEVIGSTKVVIVTTFILSAIIFSVDLLFVVLFKWLKIMG
jgi:preprotein translocase subunit SecE